MLAAVSIEGIVWLVLYLLGAAAVFAILWYLVCYFEKEWGGPPIVYKAIRSLLVVLAALVAIFVIMDLIGHPLVNWR